MKYLYIIAFNKSGDEQYYKTPATEEALEAARSAGVGLVPLQGTSDRAVTAPFQGDRGIEDYEKHAKGVELEKIDRSEFLLATGADETDVFY